MPGYARSGKYNCGICPNPVTNIIRITGIMVAVVVAIGFLVKSTLSGATKKNIHSVYIKIFMNHIQLLAICGSFNFRWPPMISQFFDSSSSVTSVTQVLFSFDCQLDTRDPA